MQAAAERERKCAEEEERAAVLAAVQEAERAEADGRRREAEAVAKAQAAQQVGIRQQGVEDVPAHFALRCQAH